MTTPDTTPGTNTPEDGSLRQQESLSDDDAGEQSPQPPEDDAAEQSDRATANAEAAKYRTQLRKVEAERDAMGERIAAYQRRECERLVADLLAQPPDLWLFAGDPVDYFDGDKLEEDRLRAAVAGLLDSRPGLARTAARKPRQWGQHESMPPTGAADWRTVIKPQ